MTDQKEMACGLMQQNRYSEALPIFLQMVESSSDDWWLYYMAGQCFRFINNIPEAVRFLNKSVTLNPNESKTLLALGIALQLADEYELAIEMLKKAIGLEPKLITGYNSIGLTYKKIGKRREAIEWYGKAIEVLVDAAHEEVRKKPDKCYKDEIEDGKTIRYVLPYVFSKTHELLCSDPTYAIIKNNIGVCLMELGDIDAAREQYRESIEFIPDGYNYPDPFINLEAIG